MRGRWRGEGEGFKSFFDPFPLPSLKSFPTVFLQGQKNRLLTHWFASGGRRFVGPPGAPPAAPVSCSDCYGDGVSPGSSGRAPGAPTGSLCSTSRPSSPPATETPQPPADPLPGQKKLSRIFESRARAEPIRPAPAPTTQPYRRSTGRPKSATGTSQPQPVPMAQQRNLSHNSESGPLAATNWRAALPSPRSTRRRRDRRDQRLGSYTKPRPRSGVIPPHLQRQAEAARQAPPAPPAALVDMPTTLAALVPATTAPEPQPPAQPAAILALPPAPAPAPPTGPAPGGDAPSNVDAARSKTPGDRDHARTPRSQTAHRSSRLDRPKRRPPGDRSASWKRPTASSRRHCRRHRSGPPNEYKLTGRAGPGDEGSVNIPDRAPRTSGGHADTDSRQGARRADPASRQRRGRPPAPPAIHPPSRHPGAPPRLHKKTRARSGAKTRQH